MNIKEQIINISKFNGFQKKFEEEKKCYGTMVNFFQNHTAKQISSTNEALREKMYNALFSLI